ncbi:MAG TPA: HEAT repeat domain-containing protein [Ktedonobacteraceae bacterium]|nr:HEAT repeat domain-containing protein [Ktedonobacteraceae bacterium]
MSDNEKDQIDQPDDKELLHAALTATNEDVSWQAISLLHRRGGRNTFAQALALCSSKDASERIVGAHVLAQLGSPDKAFHEGAVATLMGMLEREQEPEVLSAVATALGHRHDRRAIEPLARLKSYPDGDVRFGVVMGLLALEDKLAVETLIELSRDTDADVRDWATFGLGSQIELDTPAIREALAARLTDEDGDTRGEAMVGLARRHDTRMLEPLLAELENGYAGSLLLEAATEIAEPRLYPALIALQETWEGERDNWLYRQLEEAIEKCRPADHNTETHANK